MQVSKKARKEARNLGQVGYGGWEAGMRGRDRRRSSRRHELEEGRGGGGGAEVMHKSHSDG